MKKIIIKSCVIIFATLILMTSCKKNDGGSKESTTQAPTIVAENHELLGLWTAYSTRIAEETGWEDIDFEEYGATSVELLIDGKANVINMGRKSIGSYKWQVAENGFTLTESASGSVGHGEIESGVLNLVLGMDGWETDYKCVYGDVDAAHNIIRDIADRSDFVGIWKMTDYKDKNGNDIDRNYIFKNGLVLDIKDDGTLDFIDLDIYYYSSGDNEPEKCEWTFDNGYIRFTTEDGFYHNVGKFKDGVFVLSYAVNYVYFVKDPNALDVLDGVMGDLEGIDGADYEDTVYRVISEFCEETINYLNDGMEAMYVNDYEVIDDKVCWKVAMGTNSGDPDNPFTIEYLYAVDPDAMQVYRLNYDTSSWEGLAMG